MARRKMDILDRRDVLEVLYHPRRDMMPPSSSEAARAVRIPVEDGIAVGAMVYVAGPDAPVVLYFHGNGEIASDYDMLAPLYTGMGITLFVVDYRGYGISDGYPTASSQLDDALQVYQRARSVLAGHGGAGGPLFVMGRSMGSASALEIARHAGADLRGLIIESGFAHTFPLVERLGYLRFPDADENQDGFANLDKMASVTVPTLVIHGQEDWIIPVTDGRALFQVCPAPTKRMVEIPHAGHNDLLMVGQREYFGAIRDLVRKHGAGS